MFLQFFLQHSYGGSIPMPKAPLSKSKMKWAIDQTISMRKAALMYPCAYNTFKKYAKLYDIWEPGMQSGVYKDGAGKPVELLSILSGEHPNYSTAKLQKRLCKEAYLAEECSNCGYDEYRIEDMSKPLMLDYLDDDPTNKHLDNLRLLCYNCFFLLKLNRLEVKTPDNVRSFKRAVRKTFETDKDAKEWL